MLWLYLALLAYLINAFSFVIDKYLLSASIPKPFAYAFWVSILSATAVVLIPFGVYLPDWHVLLLALASGISFFAGLVFLYQAVRKADVSVSATQAGVFSAVSSAIFAGLILKESESGMRLAALIALIAGLYFLSRLRRNALLESALAGLFLGLSLVILKLVFSDIGFLNGLFWTRMGFVASAISPLAFSSVRRDIFATFHSAPVKSRIILVLNKGLIGIGFIVLYYSIRLGDVAIINALLGVQFVFIFFIALTLKNRLPGIVAYTGKEDKIHKLLGVCFIAIGFMLTLLR